MPRTAARSRALAVAAVLAFGPALFALAAQSRRPDRARPPVPPTAPVPVTRQVPFKPGESLVYDVSWSSFLTAGSATVSVRDRRPSSGSQAYAIVAEGRPTALVATLYRLYYKSETLLDAFSLLPQRASLYSEEGRRRRTRTTRFHQDTRTAEVEETAGRVKRDRLDVPADTQDALSALYALRAMPLRQGAKVTMPVLDGDTLYRVQVTVDRREPLTTPAGSFTAWRVIPAIITGSPGMVGRAMALWISDDARRLPIKLEADMPVGRFVLILREAGS